MEGEEFDKELDKAKDKKLKEMQKTDPDKKSLTIVERKQVRQSLYAKKLREDLEKRKEKLEGKSDKTPAEQKKLDAINKFLKENKTDKDLVDSFGESEEEMGGGGDKVKQKLAESNVTVMDLLIEGLPVFFGGIKKAFEDVAFIANWVRGVGAGVKKWLKDKGFEFGPTNPDGGDGTAPNN